MCLVWHVHRGKVLRVSTDPEECLFPTFNVFSLIVFMGARIRSTQPLRSVLHREGGAPVVSRPAPQRCAVLLFIERAHRRRFSSDAPADVPRVVALRLWPPPRTRVAPPLASLMSDAELGGLPGCPPPPAPVPREAVRMGPGHVVLLEMNAENTKWAFVNLKRGQ